MKRTNDFLVGATVLVGIILIVAGTLWVNQTDIGRKRARVVARFRDVGNLKVGNAVVIRGVEAGRVEQLELADGGWVLVRFRLDEDAKLPPAPVVLVGSSSMFGEWQAQVMSRSALPPNSDVRRQVQEASGEPGVLPGASLPDINQLTGVAGQIAGDVATVAERFQVAFNDSAARELRITIGNVARLSTELERTVRVQSRNLDRLSREVGTGVGSIKEASASLNRVLQRADSATSAGEIDSIVHDLGQAAAQMNEATAQLRDASRRLSSSQVTLESFLARSDSVMGKVNSGRGSLGLLLNDESLYYRSDSALAQLRSLLADIQANPKRYVSVKVF